MINPFVSLPKIRIISSKIKSTDEFLLKKLFSIFGVSVYLTGTPLISIDEKIGLQNIKRGALEIAREFFRIEKYIIAVSDLKINKTNKEKNNNNMFFVYSKQDDSFLGFLEDVWILINNKIDKVWMVSDKFKNYKGVDFKIGTSFKKKGWFGWSAIKQNSLRRFYVGQKLYADEKSFLLNLVVPTVKINKEKKSFNLEKILYKEELNLLNKIKKMFNGNKKFVIKTNEEAKIIAKKWSIYVGAK